MNVRCAGRASRIGTVSSVTNAIFPCEVCGVASSRRDTLRRHLAVVHGNRRAAAPVTAPLSQPIPQPPANRSSTLPPLRTPPHHSPASDTAVGVIVVNPQRK